MKIQILGTGCPKCKKLASLVEEAAKELALHYELEGHRRQRHRLFWGHVNAGAGRGWQGSRIRQSAFRSGGKTAP